MNTRIAVESLEPFNEGNEELPQYKMDERLISLMEQALNGNLQMYYGEVQIGQLVPYDLDYRPDLHPITKMAIDRCVEAWENGFFQKLVVYQQGAWFVVSDDYIALFAALRCRTDFVPCWILGKPEYAQVKNVQGPVAQVEVNKALGISS